MRDFDFEIICGGDAVDAKSSVTDSNLGTNTLLFV